MNHSDWAFKRLARHLLLSTLAHTQYSELPPSVSVRPHEPVQAHTRPINQSICGYLTWIVWSLLQPACSLQSETRSLVLLCSLIEFCRAAHEPVLHLSRTRSCTTSCSLKVLLQDKRHACRQQNLKLDQPGQPYTPLIIMWSHERSSYSDSALRFFPTASSRANAATYVEQDYISQTNRWHPSFVIAKTEFCKLWRGTRLSECTTKLKWIYRTSARKKKLIPALFKKRQWFSSQVPVNQHRIKHCIIKRG